VARVTRQRVAAPVTDGHTAMAPSRASPTRAFRLDDDDDAEEESECCDECGSCPCACCGPCASRCLPSWLTCAPGASGERTCCGLDPCGVLCCLLTWFVFVFCSATQALVLEDLPDASVRAPFLALVALALASHTQAVRVDPGFEPRGLGKERWLVMRAEAEAATRERLVARRREVQQLNEQAEVLEDVRQADGSVVPTLVPNRVRATMSDEEIEMRCARAADKHRRAVRYCDVCESFKAPGAHHCSVCGRCVRRMDHHCPWINNCVGEDNLRYFLLFLLYVLLSSLWCITMFAYRSYVVMTRPPLDSVRELRGGDGGGNGLLTTSHHNPLPLLAGVISVIMCLFFCVFVIAMGCEQCDAVTSGVPGIDSLKKEGDNLNLSLFEGLKRFACRGNGLSWRWFIPVPIASASAASDQGDYKSDSHREDDSVKDKTA
jgi:hypothetical protein